MNNREEWSQTEQEMQKMLDNIRKEYPDFWAEEPKLPKSCKNGKKLYNAEKSRRHRRRATIAACFTACVLGSTALTIFVNSETAHAMKFALEKKYYELSGMAIAATNPDMVSDENTISVNIADESQIETYKKFWDGLLIPEYMTAGYKFETLIIEKHLKGEVLANYSYSNCDGDKLQIQMNTISEKDNSILWMVSDEVRDGDQEYHTWKDEIAGINGINVLFPERLVSVSGKLSDAELINIVNRLK